MPAIDGMKSHEYSVGASFRCSDRNIGAERM
jgi:hypothetical protein